MARLPESRTAASLIREVRTVLRHAAESSPPFSLQDGETYVCSVCDLSVKPCLLNTASCCAAMIFEGTQVQLLKRATKDGSVLCLNCGGMLSLRVLKKNPLTEVCPSCQTVALKVRTPDLRKECHHDS